MLLIVWIMNELRTFSLPFPCWYLQKMAINLKCLWETMRSISNIQTSTQQSSLCVFHIHRLPYCRGYTCMFYSSNTTTKKNKQIAELPLGGGRVFTDRETKRLQMDCVQFKTYSLHFSTCTNFETKFLNDSFFELIA